MSSVDVAAKRSKKVLISLLLSVAVPLAAEEGSCSNEPCVFRNLREGPELPKGNAATGAREAAKPYFACIRENLETVTWTWPQGDDAEHTRWILKTTWDVCSDERIAATEAIANVLHKSGGYGSHDDELKAAARYRSGVAFTIYLLRFTQIGKQEAFKALQARSSH